jgi:hypothetical protein
VGFRAAIVIAGASAVATVALLAGGAEPDARPGAAADLTGLAQAGPDLRARNGLSWRLPAGWRAIDRPLTELADPAQGLAAATSSPRRARPAPACDALALRRRMPRDGALVLLLESRWAAGVPSRLRSYPPRPRPIRLPRRPSALECFGEARAVWFREAGRGLSAFVLLGPRAPRARQREAERLLRSLRVEPVPPPERPVWDLWPELITEAGDTMRAPPRWISGSVEVPRRLHRPRLLFYAATVPVSGWSRGRAARLGTPRAPRTGGVVLWVAEHARGPASERFPPLREDPFAEREGFREVASPPGTRSWRAGASWRGYRFSATVTAADPAPAGDPAPSGTGATEADLRRAFASAASLALSGGLRDCSRMARERRPDLCAGAR